MEGLWSGDGVGVVVVGGCFVGWRDVVMSFREVSTLSATESREISSRVLKDLRLEMVCICQQSRLFLLNFNVHLAPSRVCAQPRCSSLGFAPMQLVVLRSHVYSAR